MYRKKRGFVDTNVKKILSQKIGPCCLFVAHSGQPNEREGP